MSVKLPLNWGLGPLPDPGGVAGLRRPLRRRMAPTGHRYRKIGVQFRNVHKARWWRSRPDQMRSYLDLSLSLADKAEASDLGVETSH